MDKTMLTLKPGVQLTEAGNRVGLVRNGQTQYANNARQEEILRALVERPLSPESLMAIISVSKGLQNDKDNSLTIAEFILDFGDYLEA